jgi:hypothetical protein
MACLASLSRDEKRKNLGGEKLWRRKTLAGENFGGEKLLEGKTSENLEDLEVCILQSLYVQGSILFDVSFGEIDLRTTQPRGVRPEDMPSIGDGSPESTVSGPISARFGTPPGPSPVAWARVLDPLIDLKYFGGAYALFPTLRRGPQSASPEITLCC